jgi:hypothetical protein
MHAWENDFRDRIQAMRNVELALLRRYAEELTT